MTDSLIRNFSASLTIFWAVSKCLFSLSIFYFCIICMSFYVFSNILNFLTFRNASWFSLSASAYASTSWFNLTRSCRNCVFENPLVDENTDWVVPGGRADLV